MSTRVQSRRPTSKRRLSEGSNSMHKAVRDLDLNRHPDGASASSADLMSLPLSLPPLPQPAAVQLPSNGAQAIVIPDEDDDVVLLSSSTASSQVRGAPTIPVILIDEDSDVQQGHSHSGVIVERPVARIAPNGYSRPERNPRKRTIINCEEYEGPMYNPWAKVLEMVQAQEVEPLLLPPPPPPPPPPKEPVFNCSVCLGELDEATSTICGHIFCHKCITAAIKAQKKCPTCRKNLTGKSIHRVYLPTTK